MNAAMQPNYRGYPPQATYHRSPATPRRGVPIHGPMMPVPLAQHPVPNPHLSQRNVPNPIDTALRRSRRPTDKNLPDGVEEAVIGEGVTQYKMMRDVEKRLDAVMMRKRLDIQDSVTRSVKRFRTLRIWISNTVENQPWQRESGQTSSGAPTAGRYKVKIEGKLLDDELDAAESDESDSGDEETKTNGKNDPDVMEENLSEKQKNKPKNHANPQRKRLSHFFKSITIEFDKPSSPCVADMATINWNKPTIPPSSISLPLSADFDSLEFSRVAEVNLNATIKLVRDENPERYKLSKELASLLDTDEEARGGIVVGIWEYIKAMGIQENDEKRAIRCDDRLQALFNRDKMFFPAIPDSVSAHTSPLDPIKLSYTIRVDPEFHSNPTPTIYDIRVAVDDPLRAKILAITTTPEYPNMLRQVANLDDQLALIVQAITHSKARHAFFQSLSEDPANFIKRWVSSQKRDLEVILGEATRGGGEDGSGPEFRRGGTNSAWDTPVAAEAVRYMLAKPGR
ncbi:SWI/SNF transcription activation complex subunit [Paracoccidioides lutzii Pb01]|uniref:SWI/SNF transcription activation complex subunit n=1 Tax=Paracoccidioides lutzii (strain ATCC MYA-826 / Pb01) TaxID=502779 RepID=C1H701_PARBA|nr:SWI/SNF transcription activation complex subunit [Paracoccidioides lutzii Pb01]EEH35495.2 SWI/SNF transcription activation complex subunit [Paracoccidioides lutzii Pb01]